MAHLGKNVSSLRNFRRIPQKEMASKLNMSQQEYSRLENKEAIDDEMLGIIADILDFPIEAIKHMESSTNIQTVYQQSGNNGNGFYVNTNEKIIEMYERLLSEKDQVIQIQKDTIDMYKKQQQAS